MLLSRRNVMLGGGAATLAAGGYALLNPSKLLPVLDFVDRVLPGDAPTTQRAANVSYGADPRQTLDVYAPAKANGALPVVLFFYGGSWSSGRRQDYGFAGRAFASRGFVTVVPDYRLVPQVHFPGFVQDGAAALDWVRAHIGSHGGDAARIGVSGHSAGAYNAAMLALDPQFGVAADIRAFVGLAGPYDFYPFTTPSAQAAFGAAPEPALTQPVSFAHAGAPPSLLLSGSADTTVRPRNSKRLAAALEQAGSSVAQKLYPDVGHSGIVMALARPFRNIASVLDDAGGFFTTHL
jgi:acetyl esterase/lipase